MAPFLASLEWQRLTPGFGYKEYDRTHRITYGSGTSFQASSAPDFLGRADLVNPEESLVGAAASCHMLTFLALAARRNLVVNRYEDRAEGVLERGSDGKFWVSRILLHPRITWGEGVTVSDSDLSTLHDEAHKHCFIANSIKSVVTVSR
jgi:organic hydroperoxide reductase OsmC/OhrA